MPAFYLLILFLGLFSSYTDIKFRKIKNRHLFLTIISGLIIYIYLIVNNRFIINYIFFINLLIALGLALLLYLSDNWGAGDAKLFLVFCWLMGTKKYPNLIPFPSVIIFMNIFILSTLVILVLSLGLIIKESAFVWKRLFSAELFKKLANSFLIIFGLGWIIPILITPLRPYFPNTLLVIILYLSYSIIYGIMQKLKTNILSLFIFSAGIIARFFYRFSDFSLLNILIYLKKIVCYVFVFYLLKIIFDLNKNTQENQKFIPFAPLIFLGVIAANTDLIYWAMKFLNILTK